jgi:hypothetical protein
LSQDFKTDRDIERATIGIAIYRDVAGVGAPNQPGGVDRENHIA